jgi:threonine synthase
MTFLTDLTCSKTGGSFPANQVQNLSPAGAPLLARYDLARARQELTKEAIAKGPSSMWRYAPLLPVADPHNVVSLGEGNTPLLFAQRLGARLGAGNLLIKDEGLNPTGSFKARGMTCAVSMAKELGVKKLAAPSAGNAGGALAA